MEARIEADHEEILSYVGKPENSDKPFEKEIEGKDSQYHLNIYCR